MLVEKVSASLNSYPHYYSLDTSPNACAILSSERELQPCPLTDNPLAEGTWRGTRGTPPRIGDPALDARQDVALILTLPRANASPGRRTGTLTTE